MIVTTADRTQVMQRAAAQIGKEYVWGTAGPDTFDCSGLVVYAWSQIGLLLPHNSAQQLALLNDLMHPLDYAGGYAPTLYRGDLIGYYDPVTHVALYDGWDPTLKKKMVVQGTNEQRGIERIGLWDFATPTAFLQIGHT